MLFVSLLQGLGLFPGRSAGKEGQTAADAPNEPLTAVADSSLSSPPKKGITPAGTDSAARHRQTAVAAQKTSGTESHPRRDALKKAAETPAKPGKSKASAPNSQAEVVAVAPAKPVAKALSATPAAVPASVKPAKSPAKATTHAVVEPVPAKAAVKTPAKSAVKTVASAKPVLPAKVVPSAPPVVVAASPSSPAPAAKRVGRKASGQSQPTPQPAPSHSPDAAKATFSHFTERVMTLPVHSPALKDPKLANNWKDKPVDQLTDEEVLSMPDAEYMNDTQMAFFRHKLVRLKTDILTNAGETTEHLREDTVVVPDPADRATIEEEHALELRTRDRERKLLKKIEQAIARIDAGDYGYCDETGEPIGVGRLIARPTASLSLEAQQRRELKQKMFGD